jgi:GTPase
MEISHPYYHKHYHETKTLSHIPYPYIHMKKKIPHQCPEKDNGNKEYKYKISHKDIDKLITQLAFRLAEGAGKAVYFVGVSDGGKAVGIDPDTLHTTLNKLMKISSQINNTKIDKIRIYEGTSGFVATIRLSNPNFKNIPFF